jgi:hypothetical protein
VKIDDKKTQQKVKENVDKENPWHKVALKACEDLDSQIPMMTGIAKGEEKADIHFKCLGRLWRMADIIRTNSRRFKTITDVNRSAHYLGLMMLYQLFKDEIGNNIVGNSIFKRLTMMEPYYSELILIDTFVDGIFDLKEMWAKGIISESKFRDKCDELKESLPDSLHPLCDQKFKQMIAGAKITSLYEMETRGGDTRGKRSFG